MERIAAIVEGHTEAHFIKATYAAAHVTRPIPNGKSVSLDVIAEAILDAMELISGEIKKVVILLDRENRTMSAEQIVASLNAKILPSIGDRQLFIGVSDRQIENWVIADEQHMKNLFDGSFSYAGDGCYGKGILQELSKGVSRSPRDTANLLKSASAKRASEKSPSIASFIASLNFDWVWAAS